MLDPLLRLLRLARCQQPVAPLRQLTATHTLAEERQQRADRWAVAERQMTRAASYKLRLRPIEAHQHRT